MNRIQEIEVRMAAIKTEIEADGADLNALEVEIRSLKEEKAKLTEAAEKRQAMLNDIAVGNVPVKVIENHKEVRTVEKVNTAEQLGKELMEKRSVTVGTSDIVLPKYDASDIKPTFNEVSSLVDRVGIKPLKGGESFSQPYIKGYGTGDYTAEGADYAGAEPTFGYAPINKTKITAYAEDTEELMKLPAANYHEEVMKGISIATRKKITREILIGDGTTGHFVGIFDDGAAAIDAATDKAVAVINESTLDEIIFSFGGDEDVEDTAVLVLNKKDVKAFATLRDADGKKVYDVVKNGNTGTIDGVPFIINSACKAVSDVATTTGQYCMAYGPLSNYTMAIFSDLDVQRSTDYKFKQGMIAHRGSIFAGGNVTAKNGFLRVKKGTAV